MAKTRKARSGAQKAASKRNLAVDRKKRLAGRKVKSGLGAGVRRTRSGLVLNEFGMPLN